MYGASSHFRRLIQYFVGLSDLSYFILPYGIDASSAKGRFAKKFLKASDYVSKFDIKRQCKDILTVCLREDVYYCTAREIGNKITFQQLPSDYCKISSMSDNVCNVTLISHILMPTKHLLTIIRLNSPQNMQHIKKTGRNGTKI